jgi:hypothetical protein
MITPKQPKQRTPKEPLITPEADRALLKIVVAYGGVFIICFILVPLVIPLFNIKTNPLFPIHRFLDTISTLVIMLPFFLGINKMNAERLKYARLYATEENWKAVYYAVESFNQLGQNWMDSTGEGHYWLTIAQEKLGEKAGAEKARKFVLVNRPNGEWAAKFRQADAARSPRRISEIKADRVDGSKRLTKTKRRF